MVGVWTSATATGGGQFTFAANGRYADAAARQQYDRISNSEVLVTTQGFTGNGPWQTVSIGADGTIYGTTYADGASSYGEGSG